MALEWSNPEIQRGLVQGGLTALGAVVAAGVSLTIWSLTRFREIRVRKELRDERHRDLLLALWSDVQPIWMDLYSQGRLETKNARVFEAFESARLHRDETYTPFVTRIAGTLLEERLVKDLDILDPPEIERIVKFYHQIRTLNQMAADMRSDRYAQLSPERKRAVLLDMFLLENHAMEQAEDTLLLLEDVLKLHDKTGARPVFVQKGKMNATRRQ